MARRRAVAARARVRGVSYSFLSSEKIALLHSFT